MDQGDGGSVTGPLFETAAPPAVAAMELKAGVGRLRQLDDLPQSAWEMAEPPSEGYNYRSE
eukprot:4739181-Alexandrium_andersonii.AAC.1